MKRGRNLFFWREAAPALVHHAQALEHYLLLRGLPRKSLLSPFQLQTMLFYLTPLLFHPSSVLFFLLSMILQQPPCRFYSLPMLTTVVDPGDSLFFWLTI